MRGKHWYAFKRGGIEKLNKTSWEILRDDASEKEFSIESEIGEYELNCERKQDYAQAAEKIGLFLDKNNLSKVVSMGVGKGILEWHLKRKYPSIEVSCADYTGKALEKLQKVFLDAEEFLVFDMIKGDWRQYRKYDDIILFRLSTEFDAKTWRDIFIKCYDVGIERIIFSPTGVDTCKTMMKELKRHYVNVLRKRKDAFCGWIYTENEFYKMWKGLYFVEQVVDVNFSKIYFLKIADNS